MTGALPETTAAQLYPVAERTRFARPEPYAESVQVKVAVAPGPRPRGPAGTGPPISAAAAVPPDWIHRGDTPVAPLTPVFVTVSMTSTHPPLKTVPETLALADAASAARGVTVIVFDPTGAAVTGAPLRASSPVNVAANSSVPRAVAEYVHVIVADPPPARLPTDAGDETGAADPATAAATPVTFVAGTWPVFVTVRDTDTSVASHTGSGDTVIALTASAAGVPRSTATVFPAVNP